jgi:hypothetical protein
MDRPIRAKGHYDLCFFDPDNDDPRDPALTEFLVRA